MYTTLCWRVPSLLCYVSSISLTLSISIPCIPSHLLTLSPLTHPVSLPRSSLLAPTLSHFLYKSDFNLCYLRVQSHMFHYVKHLYYLCSVSVFFVVLLRHVTEDGFGKSYQLHNISTKGRRVEMLATYITRAL